MKMIITNAFLLCSIYMSAQNCTPGEAYIELDVNNITAGLRNSGDLWWNGQNGRYITPSDGINEVSAIFAGGLWIGGRGPNGALKLAAVQYRTASNGDYYPGPLRDSDGQAFENGCTDWDRFWVVNKSEVDAHFADYNDGSINTQIENIYSWPGRNNPHFENLVGFPIPENQKLAPFYDNNNDGNYNPDKGDYPLIKGDQSIWWVFNDNAGVHGLSQAKAIQAEIHAMAYAYNDDSNEHLNNATFYDFEVINKADEPLSDGSIGLWVDFDLGCSEDDFVGYNEEYQMMYVYNEDEVDGAPGNGCPGGLNTYGDSVPMVTIKKLNVNKYPVTSYSVIHRGIGSLPSAILDPNQDFEFYNYLKGLWRDGTAMIFGGLAFDPSSTDTTKFVLNGEPSDTNAWSLCTADLPLEDRRVLMSSAIPDLQPGQSITASYAVIYADNIDYPCPSLDKLKEATDAVTEAVISSTEEPMALFDVTISPSPTTGTISITSAHQIKSIKIIDLNGQILMTQKMVTNLVSSVDISRLAAGLYLVSIEDERGNVAVDKVVKN